MSIAELLKLIDANKAELEGYTMPPAARERFIEDRKLTFIHSTNAIEGNTLTLQETKHVLELYKRYPQIFNKKEQ